MSEEKAGAATRGDIAQAARDHYEKVSMASADWFSVIPRAINCWEREPELLETVGRLRVALAALVIDGERIKYEEHGAGIGSDSHGHGCVYCSWFDEDYDSEPNHEPTCPILQGRTLVEGPNEELRG